jgi:hypothetical protein
MRGADSSRCTGSEEIYLLRICDSPEETWHWRRRRCGFFAHGNWRAGYMACGPRPLRWTASCGGAEEAHNRVSCAAIRLFDRWVRRR